MIKVPLVGKYKSQYALVDNCDAWVLKLRWGGRKDRPGVIYAQVTSSKEGLNAMTLHRLILGLKPGDPEVDHIDGDGLNCQRYNLRLTTHAQNCMNQRKSKDNNTYKGVSWHKHKQKWLARIKKDYKSQGFLVNMPD